jgi:hypothetical protein
LITRYRSGSPAALVAVASAAAWISRASSTVMRPCVTAPTAHRPAVRAENHSAACASGRRSACQRNTITPPSSTVKFRPANQAAVGLIAGSNICTRAMSKAGFGKRCATSAGRQPGGLSHTRSLSAQLRACQAVASPARQ